MLPLVCMCLLVSLSGVPAFKTRGPSPYTPFPSGGRPSCAKGSLTFCETVDKYPTQLIQKLLQRKSPDVFDFFIDESEGLDEPPEYILHQDMPNVSMSSSDSRKIRSVGGIMKQLRMPVMKLPENCTAIVKLSVPKVASNSQGQWKFIAQDERKSILQKVEVHICNSRCRIVCTQLFAAVPLMALDIDGVVRKDTFWMPSSCQCATTTT